MATNPKTSVFSGIESARALRMTESLASSPLWVAFSWQRGQFCRITFRLLVAWRRFQGMHFSWVAKLF